MDKKIKTVKIVWTKNTIFNRVYWTGSIERRIIAEIEKTDESWPYLLNVKGSIEGNFQTLNNAKAWAKMVLYAVE
jgi:hypothetical protein